MSEKRGIEQVEKEIHAARVITETCMDDVTWSTRSAWGSHIEQAKESLVTLGEEYRDLLLAGTLAIFVTGDLEKSKRFAEVAREESDSTILTLDAAEMYKRVATGIDAALGPERTFTVSYLPHFIRGLKEVSEGLGLRDLAAPDLKVTPVLADYDAVVAFVRETLRRIAGDDLNRLYLAKRLVDQAIALRYKGTVAPVLIFNATPHEIVGLSGIFATVGAQIKLGENDEVTSALVLGAFKEAKKTRAKKAEKPATDGERS